MPEYPPVFNAITERRERAGAELIDGKWYYKWQVIPLTEAEAAANQTAAINNVKASLIAGVQAHLDSTARQRNYTNMVYACTYTASSNAKFKAEGLACVEYRDIVWVNCYAIMADVLLGVRPIPTLAELLAELPAITWPV